MACVLATGIFCDDRTQVARAVDYFKNGEGLGAVKRAIPVVHDDGLAEWLEADADQGHALLGIGLIGTFCEMAWNQGIDDRPRNVLATWRGVHYGPWMWSHV